jgi:hypothetical protein
MKTGNLRPFNTHYPPIYFHCFTFAHCTNKYE